MTADGPAHRLVVVGHGAAGLAAAVAAAEAALARGLDVEITLLEKADVADAGGNTLWSPSYMRLDAPDRVAPDFETAMGEATGGRDAAYFHALARDAPATVAWLEGHGVAFATPPYYLAAGPLRIQPVGGGRALVAALAAAAKRLGVAIRYRSPRERDRRGSSTAASPASQWRTGAGAACGDRRCRCGRSRLWRLPGRPRDDA